MFKGQIFKLKCNKSSKALHLQYPTKDIVKYNHAMNNVILSEEDH